MLYQREDAFAYYNCAEFQARALNEKFPVVLYVAPFNFHRVHLISCDLILPLGLFKKEIYCNWHFYQHNTDCYAELLHDRRVEYIVLLESLISRE